MAVLVLLASIVFGRLILPGMHVLGYPKNGKIHRKTNVMEQLF